MANSVSVWPGREITVDSFTDITTKAVTTIEWDGENNMTVTFAEELTTDEYRRIRRRIRTSPEREAIEYQADQAIGTINTFLQLSSPTNAQVVAYVKLLGRVDKALIKLNIEDTPGDPLPNA